MGPGRSAPSSWIGKRVERNSTDGRGHVYQENLPTSFYDPNHPLLASSDPQQTASSGIPNFPRISPCATIEEDISDIQPRRTPWPNFPDSLLVAGTTLGVCLAAFTVALDRTIITTAIPYITDHFHSYNDVGWYGSAYLLTSSAFEPLYGRLFMAYDIKPTYLLALGFFELGSLVCGLAPSSVVLIVGRAIQGLGAAGIITGAFVIVTDLVPLQKRPVFFAAASMLYGLGAAMGPFLGGVMTNFATWRWCFYLNLPLGAVTFITVLVFFKPVSIIPTTSGLTWSQRLLSLDLIGNVLFLGACVMLFLALQYTEGTYSWSSARVVGLLVGFAVTVILFSVWQWHKGDDGLLPPRIILQRTVAASCLSSFFIFAATIIHFYYLPIWFQAIKNESAVHAGVNMLPWACSSFISTFLAGAYVSKKGYYVPPALMGCAIGTIGAGLVSTIDVGTSSARFVGYEILTGFGLGMAMQQGMVALQTVLSREEVPIGTAAVNCAQSLGGAVFVSVGNTVLQNHLLHAADTNAIPGVDLRKVFTAGATAFRSIVPAGALPALLVVYNAALQKVFIVATVMAAVAFFVSLGLEWNSVKNDTTPDEDKVEARDLWENRNAHQYCCSNDWGNHKQLRKPYSQQYAGDAFEKPSLRGQVSWPGELRVFLGEV